MSPKIDFSKLLLRLKNRQTRPREFSSASHWLLLLLGFSFFSLAGCAEVTLPSPTEHEQEAAQLEATRRHPYQTWTMERASRVFIRLLTCLPLVHDHTYPFLGFNWWVTATGKVAIDNVWKPSPASEAGLKQGDIILAVNNWPLPVWAEEWDRYITTARSFFHDVLFFSPLASYKRRYTTRRTTHYVYLVLPGELLPAILLDLKHIRMEARGRYLTGPVEFLIQRDDQTFTLSLYPQHLPAEYGLLLKTTSQKINAYASPGRVILTQRLVNFCLNDDELAMIVGHELAHHALGHLVRGATHREMGKVVGEIITAFTTLSLNQILDWKYSMVDPDMRQVSQDAVVSVFSQDDEREADAYGLWYAFQAGYDMDKALAVWERLASVDEKDPFLRTYFLDSHPASLERMARLKKIARYFKAGRAAEVFLQSASLNRQPPPE
jgi:Zn-dependent protease with chaperone function